jgi:hypothetical protein
LEAAGGTLLTDAWTEAMIEAGIDDKRNRSWAWNMRNQLKKKGLVYEGINGWSLNKG